MSVSLKTSLTVCRTHSDRSVKPVHIGRVLGVNTRYIPESALPMTGAQVLAARDNPPAWVAAGQKANKERLAKRAARRRTEAARPTQWTRDDLIAEYTLSGLKDGLEYDEAYERAKVAASAAAATVGAQAAGELLKVQAVARAKAIRDAAGI